MPPRQHQVQARPRGWRRAASMAARRRSLQRQKSPFARAPSATPLEHALSSSEAWPAPTDAVCANHFRSCQTDRQVPVGTTQMSSRNSRWRFWSGSRRATPVVHLAERPLRPLGGAPRGARGHPPLSLQVGSDESAPEMPARVERSDQRRLAHFIFRNPLTAGGTPGTAPAAWRVPAAPRGAPWSTGTPETAEDCGGLRKIVGRVPSDCNRARNRRLRNSGNSGSGRWNDPWLIMHPSSRTSRRRSGSAGILPAPARSAGL